MLAVWLPLINGNRNNLGIINIGTATTGASIVSGKLGNCYQFTRASHHLLIYTLPTELLDKINNHSFGVAAWVKSSSSDAGTWLSITYGMRFSCDGFSLYNSSRAVSASASSGTAADGNWHHIAYTYDVNTNKMTCYRDGREVGSANYTSGYTYASSWTNNINIARDPNNSPDSYYFNGCIQDVRIWVDECPTLQLIKEISKGLVLHYPLNDEYSEGTTNILSYSNLLGHGSSWTLQTETFRGTPIYKNIVTSPNISNNAGFALKLAITPSGLNTATKVTLSFYKRLNVAYGKNLGGYLRVIKSNSSAATYGWSYNKSNWANDSNSIGKWEYITATVTIPSGCTSISNFYVYTDYATGGDCDFAQIQLEFKDHATPYVDGTRIPIVYDSSGYNNNGTITGTLTTSTDTPRYDKSTQIISGATISHPLCIKEPEWTCSCWIYPTSFSSYTYLNNLASGMKITHGTSSLLYINENPAYYKYSHTFELNKWQHVVFVFKHSTRYMAVYKNGVKDTATGPSGGTVPALSSTITLFTGFTGYVSDYREYCTALSEDDVKALYQEAAFIDHKGNIGCYLFYEDADSQITKTGQVKTEEFEEISDLSDGVAKVYELKIECNQLIEI